jgi:2'-5' RNA ligase
VEEELKALSGVASDPFPLEHIVLYRSHLRRPHPIYEPVEAFRLGKEAQPGR